MAHLIWKVIGQDIQWHHSEEASNAEYLHISQNRVDNRKSASPKRSRWELVKKWSIKLGLGVKRYTHVLEELHGRILSRISHWQKKTRPQFIHLPGNCCDIGGRSEALSPSTNLMIGGGRIDLQLTYTVKVKMSSKKLI